MKTNKKTVHTKKTKVKKTSSKPKAKKVTKKNVKAKKPVKKVSKKTTKKPIKKKTTKVVKKTTTKKRKPIKKVKVVKKEEPKEIALKEELPEIVQNKSDKARFFPLFVVAMAAILMFLLVSSKKPIVDYLFSTNLNCFKYTIDENKEDWIDIEQDTIVETNKDDIMISIQNTDNSSITTIDLEKPYFEYFGDDYIASPINKEYDIDYIYFNPDIESKIEFTASNDSVKISNNTIKTIKDGSVTIYAIIDGNKEKLLEMDVCSNIVDRPKEFDTTKPFLTCEQFTNEENEFLDKILENKIKKVGYQTRAGAVETLRFLALDFPYRVTYFSENGRMPYVDGEGRYYHKGLYLSKGKYNDLVDPTRNNKGTWGCTIYSYTADEYETNGLDCSGLLCWALYNDGFDPDDQRGANLLMNLGEIVETSKAVDSGRVKVGDFVHNNELASHVGMIIGIDGDDYYVAQAIWYDPFGLCVTKYPKEEFTKHWLQVILLDDYYKEDGQLTDMWY